MEKTNNSKSIILYHKSEELSKKHLPETALRLSLDETITLIQKLEENQRKILALEKELMLTKEHAQDSIQKYNELFDLMPIGYFILSRYGEIIEINVSGSRMLGKELTCLINNDFRLFVTDETKPIFDIFLRNTFCSQTDETCGVTLISPDNLPIYVHLSRHVTKNEEQCLVSMVDITEKKQMIADLIKAKEKAEESDQLKSAFLANMSHEIRTPMNGILGFAELLKEPDLTGEEQHEYIDIIEKSGARMLNIINDIVSISKIESGTMETYISDTNINGQTEYVYNILKLDAEKKKLNLILKNGLPDKESILKTDNEKIIGILSNLVKNAIKYTDQGSVEFGYNLRKNSTLDELYDLEFYIKDTGIGIPKDRQEAIFERFIQADIQDKMARQGAGLGLAISRAYVEMLGGKIWVESEVKKGSTFFFTIPYSNSRKS
jgi:signal transduction histidine kinase